MSPTDCAVWAIFPKVWRLTSAEFNFLDTMQYVYLFNRIVHFVIAPLPEITPIASLVWISILCSLCILVVFKKVSNQEKIKFHKRQIIAHFLEISIYRDQLLRTISSLGQILKHQLFYFQCLLLPLAIIMLPIIYLMIQIDSLWGQAPLNIDDRFIIHAMLDSETKQAARPDPYRIYCEPAAGVDLETPAMRIGSEPGAYWRARLADPTGAPYIKIGLRGQKEVITCPIAVSSSLPSLVASQKQKAISWRDMIGSKDRPLPVQSNFRSVVINYPEAEYPFFIWELSPISYFFVLTILMGFFFKPIMRVSF